MGWVKANLLKSPIYFNLPAKLYYPPQFGTIEGSEAVEVLGSLGGESDTVKIVDGVLLVHTSDTVAMEKFTEIVCRISSQV